MKGKRFETKVGFKNSYIYIHACKFSIRVFQVCICLFSIKLKFKVLGRYLEYNNYSKASEHTNRNTANDKRN